MGLHSVTYPLTFVLPQPYRLVLDLPTPEGRKAELTLMLVMHQDGLSVCRQSPIQIVTEFGALEQLRQPRSCLPLHQTFTLIQARQTYSQFTYHILEQ